MARAAYASDPAGSRGREFPLENAVMRGPRSDYQRDRDRIIHSIAFRRLRYKTQVFVAPDGDHYRVRLTHSLEVAQIARVIARTLGLDEDLTEALALAHDIGHAPFGHAGEAALNDAMHRHGGFDHNAHCLRVLMRLESPYCEHDGLNLTWETLEGLAKHNGPVVRPNWALEALDASYPLELESWPSLEAQIAALSDDIAYDNHDIDDGLRAGFLDLDELLAHAFVADRWREVERRYPGAPRDRQLRELIRSQIGMMVNDLIGETRKRCAGMETADDVRCADRATAAFSPPLEAEERRFKKFMYDKLYYHPEQVETARRAREVVGELYVAYSQEPVLMDEEWIDGLPRVEPDRSRHIADYIAGMTDRFALSRHAEIFGTTPAALSNV
ncbi:deoxyguanosinetriphosphate triphosphohydrolase-like protein [Novosphingobium marinum]|uniref:Deoxyguanosinetriphosphate triphosphohydrolase-like protein n=1 Tax=Novosphingobium marinum TaxID=1514948 RepID=A0A7Y9XTP9_9SPHN|nr:deoxyguanosinetriphosphate triphosphohydrolase [Novosphingobium marinum]NYH94394.1 dGTPase [Novosphingobium marinum]GGC22039.1 deoxyguanosinetriphosphate triphosphohydrolase-like protein [Novosphingobium marinum]